MISDFGLVNSDFRNLVTYIRNLQFLYFFLK
jgi:hypothetical protein